MLYWGHRSPWWLLHGDTIFDVGGRMEMASLDVHPTLYARSSNVRRLDQARRMVKDFPPLGWDTLGVCLSGGRWNNDLGTEHWQEGVLMDICRGGLLLHIWSDNQAVPLADRPQMAEFIRLLKARPACFANPRFIGDVRTSDVWGYCCTDGRGAMVALDNGSWEDQEVLLALDSRWGLPNQGPWDLYCWYPDHARLVSHDGGPIRGGACMTLRPFTPVLLEVVPAGEKPALSRDWRKQQLPGRPVEAARTLAVAATKIEGKGRGRAWTIRGKVPASKTGGWLAVTTEFRREGRPALWTNNKPLSMSGSLDGARPSSRPSCRTCCSLPPGRPTAFLWGLPSGAFVRADHQRESAKERRRGICRAHSPGFPGFFGPPTANRLRNRREALRRLPSARIPLGSVGPIPSNLTIPS